MTTTNTSQIEVTILLSTHKDTPDTIAIRNSLLGASLSATANKKQKDAPSSNATRMVQGSNSDLKAFVAAASAEDNSSVFFEVSGSEGADDVEGICKIASGVHASVTSPELCGPGPFRLTVVRIFLAGPYADGPAAIKCCESILKPFIANDTVFTALSVSVVLVNDIVIATAFAIEDEMASKITRDVRTHISALFKANSQLSLLVNCTVTACLVHSPDIHKSNVVSLNLLGKGYALRQQFVAARWKKLSASPSTVVSKQKLLLLGAPSGMGEDRYSYLFHCALLSPLVPLQFFIAMAAAYAPFEGLYSIINDLRGDLEGIAKKAPAAPGSPNSTDVAALEALVMGAVDTRLDEVKDIIACISGALGDGTSAAVSSAQSQIDEWAAATTTTAIANQNTHLYIGKPPQRGKKPYWHSRPNLQQPHSVITTANNTESAKNVTIVIYEDTYVHESMPETGTGALTPLETDLEALLQKVLLQRPTSMTHALGEVKKLQVALNKVIVEKGTPTTALGVLSLLPSSLVHNPALSDPAAATPVTLQPAIMCPLELFTTPTGDLLPKSLEILKSNLTEDAGNDDEDQIDDDVMESLGDFGKPLENLFSRFNERALIIRASTAVPLLQKDIDDLDASLRSSSPLSAITFTIRDVQMWNAGFSFGRSRPPKVVKESAPLPPAPTSNTPPATSAPATTVNHGTGCPTTVASGSRQSSVQSSTAASPVASTTGGGQQATTPPPSEQASRLSATASTFTPKPTAVPFVPGGPRPLSSQNSLVSASRTSATPSLSANASEFRPPQAHGQHAGQPPPFSHLGFPHMAPVNLPGLTSEVVNMERGGPYYHSQQRNICGYLHLTESTCTVHFDRSCNKEDVRLHQIPLALVLRLKADICMKCVPKTCLLNDDKMILSHKASSVFTPEIGGDRQASRFTADEALYLSLLARGTTKALDTPTQCMSLKKYVILLVARARVHADRITKSRRYEIRVKYGEIPRAEREVYEKIITHMGDSMSMSTLLLMSPTNEIPPEKRALMKLHPSFMLGSTCVSVLHSFCYRMALESTRHDAPPLCLGKVADYERFKTEHLIFASECAINICHPIWSNPEMRTVRHNATEYPCEETGMFYCEVCGVVLEKEGLRKHFTTSLTHLEKLNTFQLSLEMMNVVGGVYADLRNKHDDMTLPFLWKLVSNHCDIPISQIDPIVEKAEEVPVIPEVPDQDSTANRSAANRGPVPAPQPNTGTIGESRRRQPSYPATNGQQNCNFSSAFDNQNDYDETALALDLDHLLED